MLFYSIFSMTTNQARECSLYLIFFSQLANLVFQLLTRSVPNVGIGIIALMAFSGITGGILGNRINKKINEDTVDKLFIIVMVLIILISLRNAVYYYD